MTLNEHDIDGIDMLFIYKRTILFYAIDYHMMLLIFGFKI